MLFSNYTRLPFLRYLSLTDYNGSPTQPTNYVGTDNFAELMSIQLLTLPRLTDTESGEEMFQCGRKKVVASQVADKEAAGTACEPAYANPRDFTSPGYTLWRPLFTTDSYQTIIAATDPRFWTAVSNTVVYVSITVVVRLVLGLLLALMLQRQTRANTITAHDLLLAFSDGGACHHGCLGLDFQRAKLGSCQLGADTAWHLRQDRSPSWQTQPT